MMGGLYFVCSLVQVDEDVDVVPFQSLFAEMEAINSNSFVNDFHLQMISNAIGISTRISLLNFYVQGQKKNIRTGNIAHKGLAKCEKILFALQIEHLISSILSEYKFLKLSCKRTREGNESKWQIAAACNEVLQCFTILQKTTDLQFFTNKHLIAQKISSLSDLHTIVLLSLDTYVMDILFVEACSIFDPTLVARSSNGAIQLFLSRNMDKS
jgi:hypothetical protein